MKTISLIILIFVGVLHATQLDALKVRAEKGKAADQYQYAVYLDSQELDPEKFLKAEEWYQKSAAQKYVPAMMKLANIYHHGIHTSANIDTAIIWYNAAAAGGDTNAWFSLVTLYDHSGGQWQNYRLAESWADSALKRRDQRAMNLYGDWLSYGKHGFKDIQRAASFYEMADSYVALMIRNREWGNYYAAYKWFKVGNQLTPNRDNFGKIELESIIKYLSANEVQSAGKEAEAYIARKQKMNAVKPTVTLQTKQTTPKK